MKTTTRRLAHGLTCGYLLFLCYSTSPVAFYFIALFLYSSRSPNSGDSSSTEFHTAANETKQPPSRCKKQRECFAFRCDVQAFHYQTHASNVWYNTHIIFFFPFSLDGMSPIAFAVFCFYFRLAFSPKRTWMKCIRWNCCCYILLKLEMNSAGIWLTTTCYWWASAKEG